ncbi:MAG: hypothetical protein FJ128_05055 [Deltaproteobacteria bacterium]|nr:hypothetical protein [Deltaproteobacteria bacterium]
MVAGFGLLWLILWGCVQPAPPRPVEPLYSRVVTTSGMAFEVAELKLPGTIQELQVRVGGARQWLPLDIIYRLHFTGPAVEGFRPATVYLAPGGAIQGEVFADTLIEGRTDLGYWNTSLLKVERLDLRRH